MDTYTPTQERRGCITLFVAWFAMLILGFVILALGGCKIVKYVPVETIKHDSIYINKVQKDSILMKDSVYIREKGDTVWVEKWKTKYVSKYLTDTIYRERIDSIQVPYPIEKELSKWEKRFISIGKIATGIGIGMLVVGIVWLVLWLRKKFGK